jgi:hypothetical protein
LAKVKPSIRVARWYIYLKTKNPNLGEILEGLAVEDVGICLCAFGLFCG